MHVLPSDRLGLRQENVDGGGWAAKRPFVLRRQQSSARHSRDKGGKGKQMISSGAVDFAYDSKTSSSINWRPTKPFNSKHPKPTQELSEQFGPSIHKIKGLVGIHPKKFTRTSPKNLGRQILGNTFSALKVNHPRCFDKEMLATQSMGGGGCLSFPERPAKLAHVF